MHGPVIIGFDSGIENTRIAHGGIDVIVAKKFLDTGDVHASIDQASGQGVTQTVRRDLGNTSRLAQRSRR